MFKGIRFIGTGIISLIAGCGGGDGVAVGVGAAPIISRTYVGTQSPGDAWSVQIADTTFTAINTTKNITVSGSAATQPSGYKKLTVTSVSAGAAGIVVGDIGYAVELPSTAVIVYVGTGLPIIAASSGACPTQNTKYNWITVPSTSWTPVSRAYGTVMSTVTGPNFAFDLVNKTIYGNPTSATPTSSSTGWTCAAGAFSNSGDPTTTIGISPSGAFVSDDGLNAGGKMGVPQVAVTAADLKGKQFIGVQWSVATRTEPIGGLIDSVNGTSLTASRFSDPSNGIVDISQNITLSYTNASSGILTSSFSTNQCNLLDRPLALAVSQIGGKYFMYGISVNGNCQPYNIAVVEK